jgi:hypothetical protein
MEKSENKVGEQYLYLSENKKKSQIKRDIPGELWINCERNLKIGCRALQAPLQGRVVTEKAALHRHHTEGVM